MNFKSHLKSSKFFIETCIKASEIVDLNQLAFELPINIKLKPKYSVMFGRFCLKDLTLHY